MAAGNDVTALYLYSEPNSILMSEYATAQAGRPTETQIQKTNLEETLRSMVDAKMLNDERWTPYVVSGQQYWVRAVHYYGAWLISVVNLDRSAARQRTVCWRLPSRTACCWPVPGPKRVSCLITSA